MSNHPRRRPTPHPLEPLLRLHLQRAGCTCDPELTIADSATPGIITSNVAHDPWCPLLARIAAPSN